MIIELVPPTERLRETFLLGLRELRHDRLPWHLAVDLNAVEQDFAAFVAGKLAESSSKTHLWAVAEEQYTVPSFRGRGVATEMLRQALPVARALGLTEVLLTCDDTNVASIRVIERNGGTLRETKALDASRPLKRYYWINLA